MPGHGTPRQERVYEIAGGTLVLVGRGKGFEKAGMITLTTDATTGTALASRLSQALGAPDTRGGSAVWSVPETDARFADSAQFIHSTDGTAHTFQVERRRADTAPASAQMVERRTSTRSMAAPPPPPGPRTQSLPSGVSLGTSSRAFSSTGGTPTED